MIKKVFLILLIITVFYGISVFLFPKVAAKVDTLLGIPGFSEKIYGGKNTFDTVITDIPKAQEFKSGALEMKETVIDGVNITKQKIDTIRSGAQQIQETVEEGKQTFTEAKEVFDDASQKVDKIQGIMQDVQNLSGSGK